MLDNCSLKILDLGSVQCAVFRKISYVCTITSTTLSGKLRQLNCYIALIKYINFHDQWLHTHIYFMQHINDTQYSVFYCTTYIIFILFEIIYCRIKYKCIVQKSLNSLCTKDVDNGQKKWLSTFVLNLSFGIIFIWINILMILYTLHNMSVANLGPKLRSPHVTCTCTIFKLQPYLFQLM